MTLIDNASQVLRKAWSIRFALLSGLFAGMDAFLPLFTDAVPRGIFAGLCVLSSIAVVVSRIVAQEEINGIK